MKKAYFLISFFVCNAYGMEVKLPEDNSYSNGKYIEYSFLITFIDNKNDKRQRISRESTGKIGQCIAYPIDFKNSDPFDPNLSRKQIIDHYISFLEYLKSMS